MNAERMKHLSRVRRVVIKVGSSLLAGPEAGSVETRFIGRLARQIRELQAKGMHCLVVSSGAIAFGMHEMGLKRKPREIPKLQALAAVGQSNLMHAYETSFGRRGIKVAQVLLTQDDLSHRFRYSNARNTIEELFKNGIVPVVNENDTVIVEEIRFGDNDTLATLVSHLVGADLMVLLTDTDGLYRADPKIDPGAERVRDVLRWEAMFDHGAGAAGSEVGTGGMLTKVRAAKRMMRSGVAMAIVPGRARSVLSRLFAGEDVGTFFHPSEQRMTSRKRWLAWGVRTRGDVAVDEGARRALVERNTSLLPSGVKQVAGRWEAGDVVRIVGPDGREVARGIAGISAADLDRVKGMRTKEAASVLGRPVPDEVVHKDDMVRVDESGQGQDTL